MAFKLTPRNLEPTTALEKTLRSIVDTDESGVVKLGIGTDTVEISNEVTLESAVITGAATVGTTLDVTGDATVGGTSTLTGAVTATAGVQSSSVAVTALAEASQATIPAGSSFVTVTITNDATDVVILPTAVVGNIIKITVPVTGCELQTAAAGSDTINGVDCSGANEMAMAAASVYTLVCELANQWIATGVGADGAAQATIVPDSDA